MKVTGVLVSFAVLALLACDRRNAESPPIAPSVAPPGPVAMVDAVECEERMRAGAPAIARRSFPDNPTVTWNVRRVATDAGRVVAEIEPTPAEVGYPRFTLVAECRGAGEPTLLATYALENATWTLLSTTDESSEEFPPTRP
jgi:hypothetical protein